MTHSTEPNGAGKRLTLAELIETLHLANFPNNGPRTGDGVRAVVAETLLCGHFDPAIAPGEHWLYDALRAIFEQKEVTGGPPWDIKYDGTTVLSELEQDLGWPVDDQGEDLTLVFPSNAMVLGVVFEGTGYWRTQSLASWNDFLRRASEA